MKPEQFRFRQIHLDFHTSEAIPGIGAAFDPDAYADALAAAHVDSITTFARCHHGYLYYQSETHPERIHPHLERPNLLLEQIEACRKRGIRVPIYTTVQWDIYTANAHRDWLLIDEEGRPRWKKPFDPGFYLFLDVLHPGFRAFMQEHLRDLFASMPVDGLFLDIVSTLPSYAPHWHDAMDTAGLDPEDDAARNRFAVKVIDDWKLETTRFVRSLAGDYPDAGDCTIFYNAGNIKPRHRNSVDAYTHYELESLPGGGWGYMHFPMTQRLARGLSPERQTLGMTGRFHTAWGDFHSYKNQAALDFECLQMLALGAGCSIGDQLHPSGAVDQPTYELIGNTYAKVEAREPWCTDVTPLTEIGLLTSEEFDHEKGKFLAALEGQSDTMIGAVRMLQELKLQFDVITSDRDFSNYRLLILPDQIPADPELVAKLRQYLQGGGRLIASGSSLIDQETKTVALQEMGVELVGEAPFSPDFIVPTPELAAGLPDAPHVMYSKGIEMKAAAGSTVLADVQVPYFNRTWRHYCSHQHTPSKFEVGYPGIVENEAGSAIHFAHPIFHQYQQNSPLWCRKLLDAAIRRLLPERLVETNGPSSLLVSINEQPGHKRYVVHLLHYIPERRNNKMDIIEDVIPLHDLQLTLTLPKIAKTARLVPEGTTLGIKQDNHQLRISLNRIDGHEMIEVCY